MTYNNAKVRERQSVNSTSTTTPIGVVSEVPMNGWNVAISYEKLNIVTHKGGTFIAKRPNLGIEPLVSDGWKDVWMPLLNGVGIATTTVEYATSDKLSNEPPQDGWGKEIPELQAGQILWIRTTITYTDGAQTVFYTVGAGGAGKTSDLTNDGDGTSPFATEKQLQTETDRAKAEEKVNADAVITEKNRATQAENALGERITQETNRAEGVESGLNTRVTAIEDKIPTQASATNKLADQAFVNSSINALAAFYITYNAAGNAFPTRAALLAATTFYQGGQTRVPTQNDYAIVLADESQTKGVDGTYPTTRYSYQGGTYPAGQWDFQYIVNNTSLTQAQVTALNSGITAALVAQIGTNKSDIAAEITRAKAAEQANSKAASDAQSAAATAQQTAESKYSLPKDGIPESDLSTIVQEYLKKASTAVQPDTLKNYVTLDTEQDILGTKYFKDGTSGSYICLVPFNSSNRNSGSIIWTAFNKTQTCFLPSADGTLALTSDLTWENLQDKPTIPTSLPPSGAAGGDLTGTYPNPTIANGKVTRAKLDSNVQTSLGLADTAVQPADLPDMSNFVSTGNSTQIIRGRKIHSEATSAGWFLEYRASGKGYLCFGDAGSAQYGIELPKKNGTLATKEDITWANIPDKPTIPTIPSSLPPTGAAGGDLSGTYPSPSIKSGAVSGAKIADGAISQTKLDNDLQDAIDKANSALQSIKDSQSGSGNAVTAVTISGNTVTVTKGETFAKQADLTTLTTRVSTVEGKIPSQASATNQLADKAFVNSTVQTATANFRGNWTTWAAVPTVAANYPADYAGSKTPTVNDYLVVQDASDYEDETLSGTWRFKYSGGTWDKVGKQGWLPEYQVNETPLTSAQLAALNSGITAALVTQIGTNKSDIASLKSKNTSQDTAISNAQTTANNAMPKSGGQFTGRVSWNESSLPAQSASPYFVTIEAFANGGKTYYTSLANVKSNLGITALETSVAAKYTKPDGGIPASDLAGSIPTSKITGLGSLATKNAITSSDITDGTIVDADISTSAAIAKSKLASDVQASLAKADSALQSHQSLANYVTTNTEQLITGLKKYGANASNWLALQNPAISGRAPYIAGKVGNTDYTWTLPLKGGTIALTSDIVDTSKVVTLDGAQSIVGQKTFAAATKFGSTYNYLLINTAVGSIKPITITVSSQSGLSAGTTHTFSFPNQDGTFALLTDIPSLTNYYTKTQTDNAISAAINDAITTVLNTPV